MAQLKDGIDPVEAKKQARESERAARSQAREAKAKRKTFA
jgi:hypothetical protein